tara:strand:+ start:1548 stop:1817 length:270 start_codon:yes stop_codon:yes gene_type:complete
MSNYNEDGTRTKEQLAIDYAGMGDVINLINQIIEGGEFAERYCLTDLERKDVVKRNVDHLETMQSYGDWGDEDMTATKAAIQAGKDYLE